MKTKRNLLRKLARLDASEWRNLFAAQYAIIAAQFYVWFRKRGGLVSSVAANPESITSEGPVDPRVIALGKAIDRTASYGLVRAHCLVRSIALKRLLEDRGFPGAVIRVGVRPNNGAMLAHAWVEYKGAVVGDKERHVIQFDQLSGIDLDT